jgi:hypothetical protein
MNFHFDSFGTPPTATLELFCQPGDRVRVLSPITTEERPCRGEGIELFPLDPSHFVLGRNAWKASATSSAGETVPIALDFVYTPEPQDLAVLFRLTPPASGPDAISAPPGVEAPFLPGTPRTMAAVVDGDLSFSLKAPAGTRMEVGGKTYVVEAAKLTEVRVGIAEGLYDRALKDACDPVEIPASVTRTDGEVHTGMLLVTRTAPRLLRRVEGKLDFGGIPPRRGSVLVVRDDDTCHAIGDARVREVSLLVMVEQTREDFRSCEYEGGIDAPRVAYHASAIAYDPRTGRRRGQKRFAAKPPECHSAMLARTVKGQVTSTLGSAAFASHVDLVDIEKWALTLK